jgi:hypothetical protein
MLCPTVFQVLSRRKFIEKHLMQMDFSPNTGKIADIFARVTPHNFA